MQPAVQIITWETYINNLCNEVLSKIVVVMKFCCIIDFCYCISGVFNKTYIIPINFFILFSLFCVHFIIYKLLDLLLYFSRPNTCPIMNRVSCTTTISTSDASTQTDSD